MFHLEHLSNWPLLSPKQEEAQAASTQLTSD